MCVCGCGCRRHSNRFIVYTITVLFVCFSKDFLGLFVFAVVFVFAFVFALFVVAFPLCSCFVLLHTNRFIDSHKGYLILSVVASYGVLGPLYPKLAPLMSLTNHIRYNALQR